MLYVHDHLSDEGLSIAAVAGTVLFIHPDYFGKLFKKETGIAFTRYVMDLRMDRAKKTDRRKARHQGLRAVRSHRLR